ncbi:hypothetical protein [Nonomuraea rubra]|uniref:hypothetical protein n=1 Tax=Nonomuraea rubra TaxID=46180 RepID=UPI0033EAB5A9
MNKRDAKRRARWAAAAVINGAIASGWDIHALTDDASDEQHDVIVAALREVIREIERPLPKGYAPPPPPPVGDRP